MRLPGRQDAGKQGWLGYCLNVHPTQTMAEVKAALQGPVREIKRRLSPDAPFAVGLRLSAEAAADPDAAAAELSALFAAEGYVAYTMNGFPYGRFHGVSVKTDVYQPDWTTPQRRHYTANLARVMAALVPAGATATISTVPGGFAESTRDRQDAVADGLLRGVADLVALRRQTGRTVALALEPEPWCLLETTQDAVTFFRDWLFTPAAARRLAALSGLTPDEAAAALPRHLGLCLDVCHMAVAFETPEETLAALAQAGIPIHKIQLSAALRIERMDGEARRQVAAFKDAVYLHQVVTRSDGGATRRFLDLPEALAAGGDGEEWRIHFHVPVFTNPRPPLGSTRPVLERVLALHRAQPISAHLEVETYTWDVLPTGTGLMAASGETTAITAGDVTTGIERELEWVLRQLS
ncbi:metabolite traffic protein EboE [Nitrospirillum sp. BR 11163]|uniref:metabolite traffic protein EboE n=1 Tax=Nitrospirillum sp. BR 11163 TaxID=3104323 RepID=UPI002AFF41A6|nr:metabolite traffic protein EboE [Nitrospirillum sp. BR 11163]MEA1675981.1 metabolite traffic protein EboE [Nitrospirillum sp. BR 11163]